MEDFAVDQYLCLMKHFTFHRQWVECHETLRER